MLLSSSKTAGRQPRKWTLAEDQKLREQVEAQLAEGEVKDWCRIAGNLPGRTNKDCRKRWHNSVAGGLKKGQWSRSEDVQLARGVQQYGQRWTLVANIVGSRSADQCAKRWQQSLDPDLDRSEWSNLEDKVLIEAVRKLGRHWKDVQRLHFSGRSKNCIKNRYTVLIRRYQNQGITLPPPACSPEPSGTCSTTDDDDMSYGSSGHDEFYTTQTQVSTPESQRSWPTDVDFSEWSSRESFGGMVAPSYTHIPQPQVSHAGPPPQWPWPSVSISQPPILQIPLQAGYLNVPEPVTLASYDSCGAPPVAINPSPTSLPGNYMRGPTSSPIPRATSNSPYQNTESLTNYMRYGVQHNSSFQY